MNYHIEELNNINAADWKRLCEESREGVFIPWNGKDPEHSLISKPLFLLYVMKNLLPLPFL
jgi:hypothetical protein